MRLDTPHGCNLRRNRLKDSPATFFVTKCIEPRQPVLTSELRQVICSAFRFAVEDERILMRAFVVMPDHWHAVFSLLDGWTLPRFMHSFMSFVGGKTARDLHQQACSWLEGYYDTRIRSMKQFGYMATYILDNPVRKGLVENPEEWDASSLRYQELVTDPWPWSFEQD